MTRALTLDEVEYLAHRLAKEQMEWDEPIPDFGTRYPGKLESCLRTAYQTYAKKDLYPTFVGKAAITFYLMIKNHPFVNGNKRIAITSLFTFLYINDKWLQITDAELYNFAKWIASSPAELKDATVIAIHDFIKNNLIEIKD